MVVIIKKEVKGGGSLDEKRWFLLLEGQVTGPYGANEIENRVENAKNALVWGRGQAEWMPPENWRVVLKKILAERALEQQQNREWKMRVDHKELTPMLFDELVETLKDYTDLSAVRIWTEGFEEWKEVFQVRKVMEELGISRRKHPRVPIMGTVTGTVAAGELNAKAVSISEGGVGANNAKELQIGEKFNAVIASPNLFLGINCTMEVVYVSQDGYAGLRFLGLPGEAKASIIEYVKKFQQVQK